MMRAKRTITLTIKRELFLLGFLFLVLSSVLYACIFLIYQYNSSWNSAKSSLWACNSQIVTYIKGVFHENATLLELLSTDDIIIHAGYGQPGDLLKKYEDIHARNRNITYIYSGYADGSLYINDYPMPKNYNATSRPWYQMATEADGVAQLVYSDAATGDWLFSQCMKLEDETGAVVGVLSIDSSNQSITTQLSAKYQYQSQRSFIVDQTGTVLIHPEEDEINSLLSQRMDPAEWEAIVNGQMYEEYDKDGIKAMAYFERIPDTDFIVVTAIDASEIMGPLIRSSLYFGLLILGLSVVLGTLLSRLLIHRFAKPVMELGVRIQNLAAGQPDQENEMRFANAEINRIAQSIEVIVKGIAHQEELRKAAEYLSFHDSMTGLYNRRFFEEELRRLDVKRNYPLSIICSDVNGLKLVNDVFGHAVGDKLITSVAACLEKACREDDILARVGGDEFALILPRTSAEDMQLVIQRIQDSFPEREIICGVRVSASLGYGIKYEKEQSINDVILVADEMMYEQKIRESTRMKRMTVLEIIAAAQEEGLVVHPSPQELRLLNAFADALCPDSKEVLIQSYRLRKTGLCSILSSLEHSPEVLYRHHTEAGYRILSALDEYRSVAGYVLHYTEHWDGSGWPAGLIGRDIPLISRVMAVIEGYMQGNADIAGLIENSSYDPELVLLLQQIIQK